MFCRLVFQKSAVPDNERLIN